MLRMRLARDFIWTFMAQSGWPFQKWEAQKSDYQRFNRIVSGGRNCFRDHVDVRYVVLGITYMDGDKEYLDASLFEKCELQEFFKLQNPVSDYTHHQPGYTVCQALSGRESGGDSGRSPLFSMRGVLY